jgi:hypothetical protein
MKLHYSLLTTLSITLLANISSNVKFKTDHYADDDILIKLKYKESLNMIKIKFMINSQNLESKIALGIVAEHCDTSIDSGNKIYKLDFALTNKKECYKDFRLTGQPVILSDDLELQFCCEQIQSVRFEIVESRSKEVNEKIKSLFYDENGKSRIFPDKQSFFAKPYIVESINVKVQLEQTNSFCPLGYVEKPFHESIDKPLEENDLKACFKMHGILWGLKQDQCEQFKGNYLTNSNALRAECYVDEIFISIVMECGGVSDDFYLIYELKEQVQALTDQLSKGIKISNKNIIKHGVTQPEVDIIYYLCPNKYPFKVHLLTEDVLNFLNKNFGHSVRDKDSDYVISYYPKYFKLTKIIDNGNEYYFINELKKCLAHTHLEFGDKCFQSLITVHIGYKEGMNEHTALVICNLFGDAFLSVTEEEKKFICGLNKVDFEFVQKDREGNRYRDIYVWLRHAGMFSPRGKFTNKQLPNGNNWIFKNYQFGDISYYLE